MVDPSQLRILMTVHCEGDCRVIEQLGEKQDFESELSRLGFKHEHFMLFISVVSFEVSGRSRSDYSVTVFNGSTGHGRVYQGGPRRDWVKECAHDLAGGAFGGPCQVAHNRRAPNIAIGHYCKRFRVPSTWITHTSAVIWCLASSRLMAFAIAHASHWVAYAA